MGDNALQSAWNEYSVNDVGSLVASALLVLLYHLWRGMGCNPVRLS